MKKKILKPKKFNLAKAIDIYSLSLLLIDKTFCLDDFQDTK